jgi:predicted Zn-dependent protease
MSRLALLAGTLLLLGGCAEVGQIAGEVAATQAHESTYASEYRKARARGLSEDAARSAAAQAAEQAAARQRSLVSGVTDVAGSAGPIDAETERTIGESLSLAAFSRYGLPVDDPELQRYVNLVGRAVARNALRPGLPYRFVVIQSPLHNAFAAPGGIIFVSAAMVRAMRDEAELAGVLAHEVAHVGHRHALESIRRARFFEGVGKVSVAVMRGDKGRQYQAMIGDLQTVIFDRGLDQRMEYEADLTALETVSRTGYDPAGFVRVLETLQRMEATARRDGSWFSTHPPTAERLQRVRAALAASPAARDAATVPERFARYRTRL